MCVQCKYGNKYSLLQGHYFKYFRAGHNAYYAGRTLVVYKPWPTGPFRTLTPG